MTTLLRPDIVQPSWQGGFARSADESLFPELWEGKQGHWVPALGPTGLVIPDVTVNGNLGSLISMDAATAWVISELGYGLELDGSADLISVADSPSLSPTSGLSVSAWVRLSGASADNGVVSKTNGGADAGDYTIVIFNNEGYAGISGTAWDITGQGSFPDDEWFLITLTYDLVRLILYKNDAEVANVALTDAINQSGDSLNIGRYSGDIELGGLIGEVRVYNRALPLDQIKTIYDIPHADLIPKHYARAVAQAVAASSAARSQAVMVS